MPCQDARRQGMVLTSLLGSVGAVGAELLVQAGGLGFI